ncbi:hypothetical protein EIP91_004879 [Steccherinum ochraceum]|uniref:Hydrophobin n=1 Tax=Steccherinum ochraceum TaxID=92696 RepID=A0A4R0RE75_9APHY|nr:hypothetical protein EIP91_004879 [Steccherinum ochraceum]
MQFTRLTFITAILATTTYVAATPAPAPEPQISVNQCEFGLNTPCILGITNPPLCCGPGLVCTSKPSGSICTKSIFG